MLDPKLIPTPLIDRGQRPPVPIVPPTGLPRFRVLRFLAALARLLLELAWLRAFGDWSGEHAGQRTRRFLEEQGFLWIKLGQLLSLHEEIFGIDFCRALSQLQFQARGFPFAFARQTLEQELQRPLAEVFSEFDEAPFAAASISQVHRAVLRDRGTLVVVKVQRPDVPLRFAQDMEVIRKVITLLRYFRIMPSMRWEEMLWELKHTMVEEIDYRYEVSNLLRMRRSLRSHGIYIPEVFEDLSRRRMLVMEYLQGVLMSDFIAAQKANPPRLSAWEKENRVEPRRVGRRLFFSFLRQLMEDNLFHGDLHPGNIVLLRNSRIAFIDLGTIGTVETDFLTRYMRNLEAVATYQYDKAAELGLLLCPDIPPTVDIPALKAKLIRCYRAWDARSALQELAYNQRSIFSIGNETGDVLYEQGIVINLMVIKLARTWATLDASLGNLIPDADYPALLRSYFRAAQRRSQRKWNSTEAIANSAIATHDSVTEMSGLVMPMLYRNARMFEGETSRLAFCLGSLVRSLRLAVGVLTVFWLLRLVDWPPPATGLLHRIVQSVPAPGDSLALVLACLTSVLIYNWLGRIERGWFQRDARLP